tara:strand:- start:638 stop:997 length:360 start_codon:yes stop_codon:yes gene_type:complete
MALTNKKYSPIHSKTGSELTKLKDVYDAGHINRIADNPDDDEVLTALMYQIQQMQDELDYLRTEISSNKDNKTVVGSNTTISFGDLTESRGIYTLMITATRDFGGKVGSQTKSTILTLK